MSSRFYTHPHKLSVYTIYDYVADYLITNKIKLDSKFSTEDLIKLNQIYGAENKSVSSRKIPIRYIFLNPYD